MIWSGRSVYTSHIIDSRHLIPIPVKPAFLLQLIEQLHILRMPKNGDGCLIFRTFLPVLLRSELEVSVATGFANHLFVKGSSRTLIFNDVNLSEELEDGLVPLDLRSLRIVRPVNHPLRWVLASARLLRTSGCAEPRQFPPDCLFIRRKKDAGRSLAPVRKEAKNGRAGWGT